MLKYYVKILYSALSIIIGLTISTYSLAMGSCPAIGKSPSCAVLITITPTGALKIETDPSVPPYDDYEDVLVGVQNSSGATVYGIKLSGGFGFDGDGANNGDYAGPGTSFSVANDGTGVVNFNNGLPNNGFLWFSLEGTPSEVKLAKTIVIDPGHGTNCTKVNQPVGSIGSKDYPTNNPPAGKLYEDQLTVDVALKLKPLLEQKGYKVVLTKQDVPSCPTFLERGNIASNSRSNALISIHFNAPSTIADITGIGAGTSAIYNSTKASPGFIADANFLGQDLTNSVAYTLRINDRGTSVDNGLAILKPTVTKMVSVILEVARLSGRDGDIIHAPGGTNDAANAIAIGIDKFFSK